MSTFDIITTHDGSPTLQHSLLPETYHSKHGARAESEHVFVRQGLEQIQANPIHVFEVGFGTGLNAWLAGLWAQQQQTTVHYTGVELYPVPPAVAAQLNYGEPAAEFQLLHTLDWNTEHHPHAHFHFTKLHTSLFNFEASDNTYHLVFFDAFSPRTQMELWEVQVMQKMYALLMPGGKLTTYCANGNVRRNMLAAGFEVQKKPGPPFKREMLVATKPFLNNTQA